MASSEISCPAPAAMPVAAPSLRITFTWTLVGNVVYALCQWGMISVLAKVGTTAAVGQFALALAITAPLFMLTNLFLRGIQATDARSDFAFADYFTLRAVGTSTALLIVGVILLASRHDSGTWGVVMFVAAAKAVESFTDVIAGLLQKHERLDQVAISMMLKGVCSVAAFTVAYLRWRSVGAASAALCLTWFAVFLGYDLRVARKLLGRNGTYLAWDWSVLLRLAKLAAPVGIVMALVSLNGNVPRYAVERYGGSGELGIFAALGYLVVVVGLIVNALGQSAIVRLSRSFAAGDTHHFANLLKRMSLLSIGLSGIGMVLASVFGRTVLRLLYGPEYAAHLGLLLLLVAISGVTAVASFLGYGMSAARRFRAQLPVTAVTVTTCATAAYLLTPRWGLTGAAIAILLSGVAQVTGSLIVLTSALREAESDHSLRMTSPDPVIDPFPVLGSPGND
jgi:O-antigen/teichoic acid export membrane protein